MKQYEYYVVVKRQSEDGRVDLSSLWVRMDCKWKTRREYELVHRLLEEEYPESKTILILNWKYLGKTKIEEQADEQDGI